MIQLQFINYILDSKNTSLIILNSLDSKYFSQYSNEWEYILNHLKEYGNIADKATFLSVFPEFELIKVEETPSYLLSELFKDYQTNQLASTFNEVRKNLLVGNIDKAMSIYYNASEKLNAGIALQSVDILRDVSRYDDYIERTQNFDKYYIKTGFKELDDIIGGWDREEELATIIARTNVGKSWIVLKAAAAAVEQGLNVGLYSGEMTERKVGYRLDTLIGNIANGSLTHGNINIKKEYERYINSLPTRYKGSLKVLTPKMSNGPAGVMTLRAFIEAENLDILFVDQHSLLEDDRGAKNPIEKASNISRDLKNLQVMKRIPIVSVSQMNRTKSDIDSDLIDSTQIAQSDRIGQDSTLIIGLSRDRKDSSLLKLQLVKSRDSEAGVILNYVVNWNLGRFTFIPSEKSKTTPEEEKAYESRYDKETEKDIF